MRTGPNTCRSYLLAICVFFQHLRFVWEEPRNHQETTETPRDLQDTIQRTLGDHIIRPPSMSTPIMTTTTRRPPDHQTTANRPSGDNQEKRERLPRAPGDRCVQGTTQGTPKDHQKTAQTRMTTTTRIEHQETTRKSPKPYHDRRQRPEDHQKVTRRPRIRRPPTTSTATRTTTTATTRDLEETTMRPPYTNKRPPRPQETQQTTRTPPREWQETPGERPARTTRPLEDHQ